MRLTGSFYFQTNVVRVAKGLLGKVLVAEGEGGTASGMIVETEAYSQSERGCHAHGGKTARNAVMFENGGVAYVYLCYGIHHMFNVVTNISGKADAVLVRALEPLTGQQLMLERTGLKSLLRITSGPGKLCRAMGIDKKFNSQSLTEGHSVWIEDRGIKLPPKKIIASPRIGINYAGADALLPWRFIIKDNAWVSKN